jgi:hypothetical protein
MKRIKFISFFVVFVALITSLNAQTKHKQIVIKKGQSVDFLSAIQKPETNDLREEYFKYVFPPASKQGFKLDVSFVPIAPPIKGNYHPQFISLSSWLTTEGKNNFLAEAHKSMGAYDFLEARKKIWSQFNMTEYDDIEKNIEFGVSSNKIYVITAYWIEDFAKFKKAKEASSMKLKKGGGKLVALLTGGDSPDGYYYKPNVISITEWDTVDVFQNFIKTKTKYDEGTVNVHQWITKPLLN